MQATTQAIKFFHHLCRTFSIHFHERLLTTDSCNVVTCSRVSSYQIFCLPFRFVLCTSFRSYSISCWMFRGIGILHPKLRNWINFNIPTPIHRTQTCYRFNRLIPPLHGNSRKISIQSNSQKRPRSFAENRVLFHSKKKQDHNPLLWYEQ